jgi:hypothetical protein
MLDSCETYGCLESEDDRDCIKNENWDGRGEEARHGQIANSMMMVIKSDGLFS